MGERSTDQTVVSISIPKDLLSKIDARAASLKLPRSHYLARLAKRDVKHGGALVIDPDDEASPMDYVQEVTEFLTMAVPALAEYERHRHNPEALAALSNSADDLAENQFWADFLDERKQILDLKWIESEKAGRDIGFERAIQLWLKHRPDWLKWHPPSSGQVG